MIVTCVLFLKYYFYVKVHVLLIIKERRCKQTKINKTLISLA